MESIADKPELGKRKRGEVRSDGRIFWAYFANGKEQWLTEDGIAEKREKSKQAKRKNYALHRELQLARAKKWREDNPEAAAASFLASRLKFKEKRLQMTQDWREKNVEHLKAYSKKYQSENGHIRRANANRRYAEDQLFNLRCRMRSRTVIAFRQKGFSKDTKTALMLGCTWEELKSHIEAKFVDGMSWDRFDEIEVDHIVPIASAKTKEELLPLFHFSNLQPLWWWDNRLKRDKMPDE